MFHYGLAFMPTDKERAEAKIEIHNKRVRAQTAELAAATTDDVRNGKLKEWLTKAFELWGNLNAEGAQCD